MPRKLIVVGAGGCGREVAQIAVDARAAGNPDWALAGFIDDDPAALSGHNALVPLVGSISDWQPSADEVFVCAIGSPGARDAIATSLEARGAQFVNVIHPTVLVAPSASLGHGLVVYPYSCISTDTVLQPHVQINMHCAIGHDAKLGRSTVLSSFCDITGHVQLGDRVLAGSHVTIAPKLRVGDDAVLGMGSVVVATVRAGKRVFGNPAKSLEL